MKPDTIQRNNNQSNPWLILIVFLSCSFSVCALTRNASANQGKSALDGNPGVDSAAPSQSTIDRLSFLLFAAIQDQHNSSNSKSNSSDEKNEDDQDADVDNSVHEKNETDKPSTEDSYPDWVVNGNYEDSEYDYVVISTEPCFSELEVESSLNQLMEQVMVDRISQQVHQSAVEPRFITSGLVRDRWLVPGRVYMETYSTSVATMYRGHAQLRFEKEWLVSIDLDKESFQKRDRLKQFGLIGAATMALLAIGFGYFRLDHFSKGLYTGRLQVLAIVALLVILVIAINVGELIAWV